MLTAHAAAGPLIYSVSSVPAPVSTARRKTRSAVTTSSTAMPSDLKTVISFALVRPDTRPRTTSPNSPAMCVSSKRCSLIPSRRRRTRRARLHANRRRAGCARRDPAPSRADRDGMRRRRRRVRRRRTHACSTTGVGDGGGEHDQVRAAHRRFRGIGRRERARQRGQPCRRRSGRGSSAWATRRGHLSTRAPLRTPRGGSVPARRCR